MTHDKDDNKPKPLHDYWMIEEDEYDEIEKDILKHKKKEDNKDDKP